MSRQVVFGLGQVGRPLAEQLTALGHEVVAVNRSGRGVLPGATVMAGEATDPDFTAGVCRGAEVVYFCLNAPHYDRWAAEFPPLQRGVLSGARAAGARLVVLDNLYGYDPPADGRLSESTRVRPSSVKAAVRAAMTAELLDAHRAGQVEVVIGRASDFFGPGVAHSALGAGIFRPALRGAPCLLLGNPDQLHSYSYVPDVAAALITLGAAGSATGQIWHLPVDTTLTTRQVITEIYRLAGQRPRIRAFGAWPLRALGLVRPELREYLHTLHQFTGPWVACDEKFRAAFGDSTTPLVDALAATLDAFSTDAPVPTRH